MALTADFAQDTPIAQDAPPPEAFAETESPTGADAAQVADIAARAAQAAVAKGVTVHVRQPKAPPKPKAPQTALGRMLPTASEQMSVYKRGPATQSGPGALSYCHVYAASDLTGYVTVETFLAKYVVPTWGYGEYLCRRLDAKGEVIAEQTYPMMAPIGVAAQGQPGGVPQPGGHSPQVHTDPIVGVVVDWLRAQTTGQAAVPLPALPAQTPSGMDPGTYGLIRLLMERQQQQPSSALDEPMRRLMLSALERLEKVGNAPPPAPMLPALGSLTAAPDPGQIARDVAREVAREIAAQHAQPPLDIGNLMKGIADLVKAGQPAAPAAQPVPVDPLAMLDRLGGLVEKFTGSSHKAVEELKDEIKELRTANAPPSLKEQLDVTVEAMEHMERIGKRRTGSGDGSFGALMSETARGIAEAINATKGAIEADTVRQAVVRGTATVSVPPGYGAAAHIGGPVVRPAPQQLPPAQQTQPAPAATQAAPVPPTAPPSPAEPPPPYPDGFAPYLYGLQQATGTQGRVTATLTAFAFLGQFHPWKVYYVKAEELLLARNREAIEYLKAFLIHLHSRGDLREEQARAVVGDFESYWSLIVDRVVAAQRQAAGNGAAEARAS